MKTPLELEAPFNALLAGRALLIAGSGFSRGAVSKAGHELPTAKGLSGILANALGMDPDLSLDQAAEEYLDQFGESELADLLVSHFADCSFQSTHQAIAALPWRRIYTTNYDDVLEQSALAAGKVLSPVTLDLDPRSVDFKEHCAIHINGYVKGITGATIPSTFKLTTTSYLTEAFINSRWLSLFPALSEIWMGQIARRSRRWSRVRIFRLSTFGPKPRENSFSRHEACKALRRSA